jgi:hypothetical protein
MNYFINKIKSLKHNLTSQTINISYKLLYKLLYMFSWCQLYLYKIDNYISNNLIDVNKYCDKYLKDKGWIVSIVINKFIEIDNDGNKIKTIFFEDKDIYSIENQVNSTNSLILCDKNDDGCVNYVFYNKIPASLNYKLSNVTFIAIDLDYNNNKYLINLKQINYNYYIVNNCLNELFFKYYIKNILNLQVDEDNFNYNVTIIDNNVNIINILPHQSIIINENDYEIYPCKNEIEENEENEEIEENENLIN